MVKRIRLNYSFITLIVMLLGSIWQYNQQGQVSWMTDSLRWVEHKATSLINRVEPAISAAPSYDLVGMVERVKDGDTIVIKEADGSEHTIRLHGIDTPEHNQPYGNAASSAMRSWVSGKVVGIEIKDTDRYGRTVGVVYVDGVNVNLEMVCAGEAWWYERYAKFDLDLRACQKKAIDQEKGLWGQPRPIPPWEWRRR